MEKKHTDRANRISLSLSIGGDFLGLNTLRTGLLNCLNARSWGLIQSEVRFSINIRQQDHSEKGSMYCIINL